LRKDAEEERGEVKRNYRRASKERSESDLALKN